MFFFNYFARFSSRMSLPPRWGNYERGRTAEKEKAARMCVEKEDTVVMTMASLLFFVSLLLPDM